MSSQVPIFQQQQQNVDADIQVQKTVPAHQQLPIAINLEEAGQQDFPSLGVVVTSKPKVLAPPQQPQEDAPATPKWSAKEKTEEHSPHSTEAPTSPHENDEGHHDSPHQGNGDKLQKQGSATSATGKISQSGKQKQKMILPQTKQYVHITYLNARGQEDSFTVCEHWCDFVTEALKQYKISEKNGEIKPYHWISNFTALHYAVSKYNVKMCEFLLEAPECERFFRHYVHVVDDFYEKPIDHLCNAKGKIPKSKQPLADYLTYFMKRYPADKNDEKEILYQDIKVNGPLHLRQEVEEKFDMSKMINEAGEEIVIASGESGPDLTNIMTAYEVEEILPAEMKKNFKIVAKSGFDGFAGGWNKGESPLHWAASRGRTDVCRMLCLLLKADPEKDDDKSRSAIKLAKIKKHHALARMLHTLEFPIERDHELKKKKEHDRRKAGDTNTTGVVSKRRDFGIANPTVKPRDVDI